MDGAMYIGWHDPSKRKPAAEKLRDAVERFIEKTGRRPAVVLCDREAATGLGDEVAIAANGHNVILTVRVVSFLPRWTYYVGDQGDGRGIGRQPEVHHDA